MPKRSRAASDAPVTADAPRPPPLFIGDHLAIDFLNSTASPAGAPVEWLGDGADLLDWLRRAGAIDADVAERLPADRLALDAVAREARALRAWLRGFVERRAGAPLGGEAVAELKPLNSLLGRDAIYRQVEASGEPLGRMLRWREARRWTSPDSLLQPIAAAIGDLLCAADFRLIRRCEAPACSLMFYDRTKSHARRWCSMAVCGNRAKAAAHRARRRQTRTSGADGP